jgi:hypothetical protein
MLRRGGPSDLERSSRPERDPIEPALELSQTFWEIAIAIRRRISSVRARRRPHRSPTNCARRAGQPSHTTAMLLLPWALLPTITMASNAWHTDEDCGCHNLNSAWGIRTMFERGYNASLAHRATDLKTLKEKSKQTKSEKKLRQALTYELWRSLRAYRSQQISTREAVHKSNCRGTSPPLLNHDLRAIDATSARWRGGVGLTSLDSVINVALSPRNDLTKNYRTRLTD